MQATPPYPGQECYLFTYVLLRQPNAEDIKSKFQAALDSEFGNADDIDDSGAPGKVDPNWAALSSKVMSNLDKVLEATFRSHGLLGWIKFFSAHNDPKKCHEDFKRVADTNEECPMKWGISGQWEPIRTPETDTEGTVDIVKLDTDEEEFMGEKIPKRDVLKDTPANRDAMERVSIDTYKANIKAARDQERKLELRKKAMAELDNELQDPKSLASYAQLHWKRLTQKSAIMDLREKITEAQKALANTIKELGIRRRKYPHYENQWQDKIRRIQKEFNPKHAEENPVDKPIAELGDYDDEELAQLKIAEVKDDFDRGIGVEAKGKNQADNGNVWSQPKKTDKGKEEAIEPKKELSPEEEAAISAEAKEATQKVAVLESEVQDRRAAVAKSFAPEAPITKLGPKGGKKGAKKGPKK
jgi:hypothetical protein